MNWPSLWRQSVCRSTGKPSWEKAEPPKTRAKSEELGMVSPEQSVPGTVLSPEQSKKALTSTKHIIDTTGLGNKDIIYED
ncbi:MAG: hypothetical protein CSB34_02590 [Desulfobulbus propionicus]|nr:MAG: hypothetical protein CSB34_02590 [Desulfobulbus propionicus]